MNALRIVIDGWHLQHAWKKSTGNLLDYENIRLIRNSIISAARFDNHEFPEVETFFVSGGDSECVPIEKRKDFRGAIHLLTDTTKSPVSTVRCPIHFYFFPLIGNKVLQQPHDCDARIAFLIKEAKHGSIIYFGNDAGIKQKSASDIPDAMRASPLHLINVQMTEHVHYNDVAAVWHTQIDARGTFTIVKKLTRQAHSENARAA